MDTLDDKGRLHDEEDCCEANFFFLPSSAIGKKWEAAGPSDRYFYEVSEHSEANLKIENLGCCFL